MKAIELLLRNFCWFTKKQFNWFMKFKGLFCQIKKLLIYQKETVTDSVKLFIKCKLFA